MHHFLLQQQWYRKSIEYMQDVRRRAAVDSGCAVLPQTRPGCLQRMMDCTDKQNIDKPEAQAGLTELIDAHSIVQVKSTMGQGDFVLEYPKLHELAASDNPIIRGLHDFTWCA